MIATIHPLRACVDSNVIVSALGFGGVPFEVLSRLLRREFYHVTGTNILAEVEHTLLHKVEYPRHKTLIFLEDFIDVSSVYIPDPANYYIEHDKDNLVLDVALTGRCDILVTGDRKHLIPLSPYQDMIIESPAHFLARLDQPETPG